MHFSEKKPMKHKHLIIAGMVMSLLVSCGSHIVYSQQLHLEQLQQDVNVQEDISREKQERIDNLSRENEELKNQLEEKKQEERAAAEKEAQIAAMMDFVVTAYDLSVESCGKPVGSHGYGLTASGFNLAGHTLESARAIAVDPSVIPIGSKVEIIFDDPAVQHYSGVYTAVDTGGAIQGNRIDLFVGDFGNNSSSQKALNFGCRNAKVRIL